MPLYWSKRGDVACAEHAPVADPERWLAEGWRHIVSEKPPHGTRHECRHCVRPEAGRDTDGRRRKPLILNVDDRPPSLYARERLLKREGFAVVNATTGADALSVARRVRPSALLLDVHLPDGDGRDICRTLKGDPELGSMPIVLISATLRGHADSLDGMRWGGCDAYLTEPVDPASLGSTLRSVLSA
jgi:CheY-like chemotaxis protein